MNISFIGMSGAGKSYVGEFVAAAFGLDFIDIDRQMEEKYGQPLQVILHDLGDKRFLEEQERQILALTQRDNLVISPGGSVVYSPEAMDFLCVNSVVVYLDVSFEIIQTRISARDRGIVGLQDRTLEELYVERFGLYKQYAHYVIAVEDKTRENITSELRDILNIIS